MESVMTMHEWIDLFRQVSVFFLITAAMAVFVLLSSFHIRDSLPLKRTVITFVVLYAIYVLWLLKTTNTI